ncbi:hypothetical protein FA15DRAFT_661271 [Coprinopsis marcescibilis]|uniref:HTH CENPB-type domain-containing protein n=1 Tax=Coprinopsis marcescibilis TaxID=230819 RepID=A0A5C3KC84_COPMA|nr:hypothetical protein FA15DRAFT_661271 [Coprinopsis marcescibilis]
MARPAHQAHAAQQKLSPAQEEVLIIWAQHMARGPLGKNWVTRFLLCHPELKIKWTQRLEKCRAQALNPAAVNNLVLEALLLQLWIGMHPWFTTLKMAVESMSQWWRLTSCSEKGSTDQELGYTWLKKDFEPETSAEDNNSKGSGSGNDTPTLGQSSNESDIDAESDIDSEGSRGGDVMEMTKMAKWVKEVKQAEQRLWQAKIVLLGMENTFLRQQIFAWHKQKQRALYPTLCMWHLTAEESICKLARRLWEDRMAVVFKEDKTVFLERWQDIKEKEKAVEKIKELTRKAMLDEEKNSSKRLTGNAKAEEKQRKQEAAQIERERKIAAKVKTRGAQGGRGQGQGAKLQGKGRGAVPKRSHTGVQMLDETSSKPSEEVSDSSNEETSNEDASVLLRTFMLTSI